MRQALAWGAGLALCLAGVVASAETWTNQAGKVIAGKLLRLEGEQAVLQRTNGHLLRVPLSSFTPADQVRAREQTGTEKFPAELRAPLEQAEADIRRAAQFLQGGKISREDYLARCEKIKQRCESLARQALKDRGQSPDDPIVERIKRRIEKAVGE